MTVPAGNGAHGRPLRVVVAGAGLGGVSAAVALRRVGHLVTVVEQADRLGEVGAGISLAPNATRALIELGLGERLESLAVNARAFVWRRWRDGSILNQFLLAGAVEERFGFPYWHVHRADLHAALVDAAVTGEARGVPAQIVLSARVVDVDPGNSTDPACVRLADGRRFDADLVVGADGINSPVRAALFGSEPSRFSGDIAYRSLVPAERLSDASLPDIVGEQDITAWLGPGCHVVHYYVRHGELLNLLVIGPGTGEAEARESAVPVGTAELVDRFSGWDPRLLAVFEAAPAVARWGLFDRDPIDRWTAGRVALLGDACHAMLPYKAQGAAQAIEDAVVLSEILASAVSGDVVQQLPRYEAARKFHTTELQLASRASRDLVHAPDGPEQEARDARLRAGAGGLDTFEGITTT